MTASEIFARLPREGSYLLEDDNLALIELKGSDVTEWLQGQATNDLRGISEGHPISFCLCQPTGQLLALCELHLLGDRYLVLTDNGAAVLERAESMVVMEDVAATDLRLALSTKGIDDAARIELGIPKRSFDYTEKTLPPELGLAFEKKFISYNKGCYTGQEVLMRIHSRGHTNKTWVGLLLDQPVQAGSIVSHESREDAGVITSAAISPEFGPIASAMLRNEASQDGEEVSVQGVKGIVRQMPIRK